MLQCLGKVVLLQTMLICSLDFVLILRRKRSTEATRLLESAKRWEAVDVSLTGTRGHSAPASAAPRKAPAPDIGEQQAQPYHNLMHNGDQRCLMSILREQLLA